MTVLPCLARVRSVSTTLAAMKESSIFAGVASIMVAGDLSKFYEHIGHEKLIDEAVATGYPFGSS